MATDMAQLTFDGRPWFADTMEADLRAKQKAGAHLVFRRDDGEWVREAPDGTQKLLGYHDEEYVRRKWKAT
ncbi:hypothetical protein GCM10007385_46970 [Tateyamaria omphalii]|uniref:hypothetical protein n=1 Tax=Tateyamaria omphalii TaxID=299262 RepID=UPI0016747859|nr:hypothetical protein [Tateyamaria omphalii]GGX72782.1 hypothetical protein GCM10007385_46970 [Tateyamaria omphalii]